MLRKPLYTLLLIPTLAYGQYERPGSATAQFLKLGVSARAAGLGDAYIAVVSGAEAAFYNPAALASTRGFSASTMHNEWFADINHDFVAMSYGLGGNLGAVGIFISSLTTDQMDVRTPLQPEGTGETFYVNNYRIGLSYARELTNRVNFGGTLSFIRMGLYGAFNENAIAADISAVYDTGVRGFRFGMKIANFGSSITFINEEYPLPLNFTFGVGIHALEMEHQTVVLSLSAMKPNDGQTLTRTGLEWRFQNRWFLRGGYKINDDIATFAFGGGIKLDFSKYKLSIDYAYSEYGFLGAAHRFSMNLN